MVVRGRLNAAVFDAVTASRHDAFVSEPARRIRDARSIPERNKAWREGNFVAIDEFGPSIRKIEIVRQPRQNVVT